MDIACFCVSEDIDRQPWVVLYDGEQKIPVVEITRIPATRGGLVAHNVSNVLHAVAASHLLGIDAESISKGLQAFEMNFENTPGRLNFYDEHPFKVIMDYAHNADGMNKLGNFIDTFEISGRKILMFQVRGDQADSLIRKFVSETTRHFDHYVCRTHPVYTGPDEQRSLKVMKRTLLDAGVDETQITTTTDPDFAVDTMLQMGREGDLLVFAPGSGQREDTWQRIISFEYGAVH
jgi:cyanophycin synthetase